MGTEGLHRCSWGVLAYKGTGRCGFTKYTRVARRWEGAGEFRARVGSTGRRRLHHQWVEIESSVGGEWYGVVGLEASETQLQVPVTVETTAQ